MAQRMLAAFLMVFLTAPVFAEEPQVYTGTFSDVAADGYDVVAYFTEGKAVEGDSDYATQYKGVTWHFVSAKHRDRFEENPGKYAPAYGGYCAWSVSQGRLVAGNPRHWAIEDGRLFLNYNAQVHETWLAKKSRFIAQADANWPQVLQE